MKKKKISNIHQKAKSPNFSTKIYPQIVNMLNFTVMVRNNNIDLYNTHIFGNISASDCVEKKKSHHAVCVNICSLTNYCKKNLFAAWKANA